jgi:hypothetical protein
VKNSTFWKQYLPVGERIISTEFIGDVFEDDPNITGKIYLESGFPTNE